jgi:hypothetical protein
MNVRPERKSIVKNGYYRFSWMAERPSNAIDAEQRMDGFSRLSDCPF